MPVDGLSLAILPDWYRIERDTEKAIEKLKNLKELDFYLKNPDEFLRRLAIRRLLRFPPKESVYALREVLEDPLETEGNKYLAAWVLKSLSVMHNYDIFITNRYLARFSGTERYEDLFGEVPEDEIPAVRFDFSSSPLRAAFKLDGEETARPGDIVFETDFNLRQWLGLLPRSIGRTVLSLGRAVLSAIKVAPSLGNAVLRALKRLSGKLAVKGVRNKVKQDVKKKVKPVPSDDPYGIYRKMYRKPGIGALIKKGLFNVLYVMFFPLRLVLKHKLAVLFFLAALYVIIAFTDHGRAFTNKYMGFDMKEVQSVTVERLKSFTTYALGEFNRLTGVAEWKENRASAPQDAAAPSPADKKVYLVTAENGLNIRQAPDPSSGKVGGNPLPFGSTVTYLLKSENDPSGKAWYYVKTGDGRTGWVSAKFLKEKKEG